MQRVGCELQNLPKELNNCLKMSAGKKSWKVLSLDLTDRAAVLVGINWLIVACLTKPF